MLAYCQTNHRRKTAYHSQTNGFTKRLNKMITDMLAMPLLLPFAGFISSSHQVVFWAGKVSTGIGPVSASASFVSDVLPAPVRMHIKGLTSSPWASIKRTVHDGSASGHGEAARGKMFTAPPVLLLQALLLPFAGFISSSHQVVFWAGKVSTGIRAVSASASFVSDVLSAPVRMHIKGLTSSPWASIKPTVHNGSASGHGEAARGKMFTAPPVLLLQALLLPFAGFISSSHQVVFWAGKVSTGIGPVSASASFVSDVLPAPVRMHIKGLTSSPWASIKRTVHDGSASGHGEAARGKMFTAPPVLLLQALLLPFAGFISSSHQVVFWAGKVSTGIRAVSASASFVSDVLSAPVRMHIKGLTSSPWASIKPTVHNGSASGHGEAARGKMFTAPPVLLLQCRGLQAGQPCGTNCTCCYHSQFPIILLCVADSSRLPHGVVRPANG
ncbi:uncharacterized protein LOC142769182 [Rhipicephalus microplus]|uniref:uncharacterized protein LOC142769182 n=1 Tax=Rhipicephalus microplus TaxID=6941 RepID=UPI003F6C1EFF